MNKVEFSRAAKVPFCKSLRKLYRRKMGRAALRQVFREFLARERAACCVRWHVPMNWISRMRWMLAHGAKELWGRTSVAARALILNCIADRMEANFDLLATAETWDNGKPIRETRAADLPLAIDHFRYFAGAVRGQEGSLSEIDHDTVAYHFHEPLGVVGQIIPWNFPLLMAMLEAGPRSGRWKLCCAQAGRTDPGWHHALGRFDRRSFAAWRAQHCQRFRPRGRQAARIFLAIARSRSPARTTTGRLIMQYASQNLFR